MERFSQFTHRHIGSNKEDHQIMLKELKCESLNDLLNSILPKNILLKDKLTIESIDTEIEMLDEMSNLSRTNKNFKSYIGMGYHNNITPSVIHRNMIQDPGWYTAYTPYQPEISQGRLEMLMNFQQMIIDLTGMDIANASLLDESTAVAEAMVMSFKIKISNLDQYNSLMSLEQYLEFLEK